MSAARVSAILLNESYYRMLLDGRREVDDIDIKKHKNDIVRLSVILEGRAIPSIPEEVRKDMEQFIAMYEEKPVDLKAMRIKDTTNEEIIMRLKKLLDSSELG